MVPIFPVVYFSRGTLQPPPKKKRHLAGGPRTKIPESRWRSGEISAPRCPYSWRPTLDGTGSACHGLAPWIYIHHPLWRGVPSLRFESPFLLIQSHRQRGWENLVDTIWGILSTSCGWTKYCTTLKPWLKPLFVGIYRVIIPGFLKWCRILSIHSMNQPLFINMGAAFRWFRWGVRRLWEGNTPILMNCG